MTHLEIEYKTLLTESEYHNLLEQFHHVSPVTQTNYYFDTKDFALKHHHMSLRIRTLPNIAELTLKIPQEIGNIEHNFPLSLEEANAIIHQTSLPKNSVTQPIIDLGISLEDVQVFGQLKTKRREMQTPIGLMALDCNDYADIRDYELELEVTDAQNGKNDFEQFLEKQNITYKFALSKVARFSQTLPNSQEF